ncbi:hypothetical protein [Streptomyces sp. NPDC051173]
MRHGASGAIIALSGAGEGFEEAAVSAAPPTVLTGADFPGRRRGTGTG